MTVTNDGETAERLRKLRVHGGRQMYHHEEVGYNSRLDALQAAVLSAKLPHLRGWSDARRHHAAFYDGALAGIVMHTLPAIFYVLLREEKEGATVGEIMAALD